MNKSKGHATFFLAEDFFSLLTFFHVLYIDARPGGGKTILAVLLAAWLQSHGLVDRTLSNFPVSFAEKNVDVCTDAAIILDETWMYITNKKAVYSYGGFVRKVNSYLLMPSVYPPHRLLTRFKVKRFRNLFTFGIPAWWYRWYLNRDDEKDQGTFFIIHPERAFGSYDTKFIPSDDGGIVAAVERSTKYAGVIGQESEDDDDALEDALADVAEEMQESVTSIRRESANWRKRSRSK